MSDDPKISARYRELPREEPPRALDEAILAASRRAVEARPAPLVVPTGRRRWYFPVAAAAIIVLAVAVTMHVERDRPDPEAFAEAPSGLAPAPAAPAQDALRERMTVQPPKPAASPERSRKSGRRDSVSTPDPQPERPALEEKPAPSAQRDEMPSVQRRAAESTGANVRGAGAPELSGVVAAGVVLPPEQWLQGIADLRRQGRQEEADKALAEFRKRYPDYKIPEAMRERVERR